MGDQDLAVTLGRIEERLNGIATALGAADDALKGRVSTLEARLDRQATAVVSLAVGVVVAGYVDSLYRAVPAVQAAARALARAVEINANPTVAIAGSGAGVAAATSAPTSGEWYSGKPAAYAPKGGKTYTHRAELPIVGGLKWVHLDMPASPRLGVKHGGVLLCSLYVALAGKAGTQVWVRAVRKDTNDDTAWLGPVTISAKGTANISHLWSIANPREPIAWDIRATAPITVHNRYSKVALVATR